MGSWPGLIILGLNLCLLVAAWLLICRSFRREQCREVRAFYCSVLLACGIYFASLPAVCVLAAREEPWWRRKVVERAELGSRCAATGMLLFCLRPSYVDLLAALSLDGGPKEQDPWERAADEGEALTAA